MVKVKGSGFSLPDTPLVPYPSGALVPERDVDYMPVLEARHLGIDFGGLTAVDDFSLTIGRTEIAGLIGPNGAGKTTVFNLLTSVYQPTRGSVLISGIPTAGKSTYQVSQMGIAARSRTSACTTTSACSTTSRSACTTASARISPPPSPTASASARRKSRPSRPRWRCSTSSRWPTSRRPRPEACPTARSAALRSCAPSRAGR